MLSKLFIKLFVLLSVSQGMSQGISYFQNIENCVYIDDANIRNQPNTKGEILTTVKIGTSLMRDYYSDEIQDTINNRIGHWIPIIHQGTTAYIWNYTLSKFAFKSHKDPSQLFLFQKISDTKMIIKVIDKHNIVYTDSVQIPILGEDDYLDITNLGFINNNHIEEVIGIASKSFNHTYIWNGVSIKKKELRFEHSFLKTQPEFKFPYSIISSDKVNCRLKPSSQGEIVMVLPKYALVEVLLEVAKEDKIGDINGWWTKIKFDGKIGYVWNNYISIPQSFLKATIEANTWFAISPKRVFAIRDNKIISHITYRSKYEYNPGENYISGNCGLSQLNNLIHIRYSGEACGIPSGEFVLGWDGKNLSYLFNDYSVGDGGYYTENSFFLPSDEFGEANRIIHYESSGELLPNPNRVDKDDFYMSYSTEEKYNYFKYENNTLIETDSKYSKIKNLINEHSSQLTEMNKMFFGSINDDDFEDAIAVSKTTSKDNSSVFKLWIILGTENNEFILSSENKNIFQGLTPTVDIQLSKNKIKLDVINSRDYYSEEPEEGKITFRTLEFQFLHSDQTIRLRSDKFHTLDYEEGGWKLKKQKEQNNFRFKDVK